MEFIKNGKYVEASYVLTVGEEDEVMESVPKERPLAFIFGNGQMLESFEKNMKGLKPGDSFDFRIPCEEAFGKYEESRVQEVAKEIFFVNGEFDKEHVLPGRTFQMVNSDGDRFNGSVLEVKDECVIMDFNHPLAGEDLHFAGEVLLVRDATAEEMNPPHCGGCCSGCHDGDCGGSHHEHEGGCCGSGCCE